MTHQPYFILILTIIFFTSCKEEDIAVVYNECYANEVTVNGISIKHYLKGFESELIKSGLLKDSTGKSYKDFFFEYSDYDYVFLKNNYSFMDSIKGVEFDNVLRCPKAIAGHKDINNSIFGKLAVHMTENNGDYNKFFESMPFDSIFNERTFEFDYIKHKLFGMIKIYDIDEYQNGSILCKTSDCPKIKETL